MMSDKLADTGEEALPVLPIQLPHYLTSNKIFVSSISSGGSFCHCILSALLTTG